MSVISPMHGMILPRISYGNSNATTKDGRATTSWRGMGGGLAIRLSRVQMGCVRERQPLKRPGQLSRETKAPTHAALFIPLAPTKAPHMHSQLSRIFTPRICAFTMFALLLCFRFRLVKLCVRLSNQLKRLEHFPRPAGSSSHHLDQLLRVHADTFQVRDRWV